MSNSFATPWTVVHQDPLSMGFPRQEYRSGSPFPSPGDLPDLGIEHMSSAWQTDSLPLSHKESPIIKYVLPQICIRYIYIFNVFSILDTMPCTSYACVLSCFSHI